jgi:hypothetical protein
MDGLEAENKALKAEVAFLRAALGSLALRSKPHIYWPTGEHPELEEIMAEQHQAVDVELERRVEEVA